MTEDEVIEMARQAGLEVVIQQSSDGLSKTVRMPPMKPLEAFAKLVEDFATAKEREACAKVCDARYMGDNNREDMEAKRCAKAIRNRGEA
jgi:hypothetical protein